MKFTLLFILTGLMVLSCKKEPRTEKPLTADTIIADTMRANTSASIKPMAANPADSIRIADSISHQKRKDTVKTEEKKTIKK
ncbi:hypothetical protein [Chryseobacterium contaminans]|uniref:hypothetical protein n=1 Tax=Chryseobacterium contaminans TaxID=1423959 RepID=UPI003017FDC8